jgi:Fe-S-cluster containining protein
VSIKISAGDLDAGEFAAWIEAFLDALRGEQSAAVPCGGCTACCTSAQFVHIGPDETDALAHIPAELLFPAPRMPPGHKVLGYDRHGRCPMLGETGCSIYEHRPRTCRTYDCRVFAAAGIVPVEDGKHDIARRVRQWRFRHATPDATSRHEAVRAAARFLREHPDLVPPSAAPATTTQLAVRAAQLHAAFLATDPADGVPCVVTPAPDAVRVELRRWTDGR